MFMNKPCAAHHPVYPVSVQGGKTLLHWAAQYGDSELVAVALANNPLPDPRDARGNTPLHLAVINAHTCALLTDGPIDHISIRIRSLRVVRGTPPRSRFNVIRGGGDDRPLTASFSAAYNKMLIAGSVS